MFSSISVSLASICAEGDRLSFWFRTKPEGIAIKYAEFVMELKKFLLKFQGIWCLI